MNLKDTVKKPSPEEIESKLKALNMTDDKIQSDQPLLKSKKIDSTTKINAILPDNLHIVYKLYCQYNGVDMQIKTKELIEEWVSKQPKLGI